MTDTSEQPETIEFHGRQIAVKRPSHGQLMVIPGVLRRIEKLGPNLSAEQAESAFNKVLLIVRSIMPDERDHEWLEDSIILGEVEHGEVAEIITKAVAKWIGDAEKEQPKPVKKAAKTTRKRAPSGA